MLDLALSVIYFSLCDEFFPQIFDILKPGLDPGRMVQTNMPEEHEQNDKKYDDEKSFMWLTACVLFCRTGAAQGETE